MNAALPAALYKKGLRNPRTGLPAPIKRSLTSAIMLAKMGVAQLVPFTAPNYIERVISKLSGGPEQRGRYSLHRLNNCNRCSSVK